MAIRYFHWQGAVRVAATLIALSASALLATAAPPDTDALRAKYPDYGAALAALGDEQTDKAIAGLSKLASSEDVNLAADAAFFLGRAYVMQERFEEALPLFTRITQPPADQTTHAGEALYLRGLCEARLLKRKEAIASLGKYLEEQKDGPERIRVDAWRQWTELKRIKDGDLEDIQQRMDYSRRRLALEDAGKKTQGRQEEIVTLLTKLIGKEEEEEDQNDSKDNKDGEQKDGQQKGSKQGKTAGSKPGSKSGQKPGSPGPNPGGNKTPSGDEVVRRMQNPGSRGQFGEAKDRKREERIFGELKTRFPARYKEQVEQYYKNLQEDQE